MVRTEVLNKWQSRWLDRERIISILITIFLILFFFTLLNVVNIPKHRRRKKDISNIDILIEKYRPKLTIPLNTNTPIPPKVNDNKVLSKDNTKSAQRENPAKFLSDLENFSREMDYSLAELKKVNSPTTVQQELQIVTRDFSQLNFPASFDGDDLGKSSLLRRFPQSTSANTNLTTLQSSAQPTHPRAANFSREIYNTTVIPEKKQTSRSKVTQIKMIELPQDIQTKMPKIFVNISQWMKENPVALPDAIKKFMSYRPPYLTSRVEFQIDNRFFEIYLLCIESTYEIKICLIEGNRTTLLIDEGFTHESHYLRTGKVYRMHTGEILSIGTKQEPASKSETQEFYQIFLSWWKSTGMDN